MTQKMKQHFTLVFVFALLLMLLASCGKKEEAAVQVPETEPVRETQKVSIANPVAEVTAEQLQKAVGFPMDAPAGAENVKYFTITTPDAPVMGEIEFTSGGVTYIYRAQETQETESVDISGYYGDTTETKTAVTNRPAVVLAGKDFTVIHWLDVVPGIQYSLSAGQAVAPEAMAQMAQTAFVPAQE